MKESLGGECKRLKENLTSKDMELLFQLRNANGAMKANEVAKRCREEEGKL